MQRRTLSDIDLSGIEYMPETGDFFRVHKQTGVRQRIQPKPTKNGYLRAKVGGRLVLLHALAYYLQTGEDPDEIDHINRVPADNRWANLRNCTRNTNVFNSGVFTGGYVQKVGPRVRRYTATIRAFGKDVRIGAFQFPDQANAAYLKALSFVEKRDEVGLAEFVESIKVDLRVQRVANHRAAANELWRKRRAGEL